MSNTSDSSQMMNYEIRVAGQLSAHWSEWFEGFTVALEPDGTTRLTGPVIDQAALYGLLKKVRDLGLPLISVNPVSTHSQKEHTS